MAVLSQLKIATVIVSVQQCTTGLQANNALLGCLLYFCCHVVTEGHWGLSLLRPPAVGETCPSSACWSPARPSQALGHLTVRCVVVVGPSNSHRGCVCLLSKVHGRWPKFAPPPSSRCLPLPLRKLCSPSPLLFAALPPTTRFLAVAILLDDITHTRTHTHHTPTYTHTHTHATHTHTTHLHTHTHTTPTHTYTYTHTHTPHTPHTYTHTHTPTHTTHLHTHTHTTPTHTYTYTHTHTHTYTPSHTPHTYTPTHT